MVNNVFKISIFIIIQVVAQQCFIIADVTPGYYYDPDDTAKHNVTTCIEEDAPSIEVLYISLVCKLGSVVVFENILSSYIENTTECRHEDEADKLCAPGASIQDVAEIYIKTKQCLWKRQMCSFVNAKNRMMCSINDALNANFMIVTNHYCVQEKDITDVCDEENTIYSSYGYILTPSYPSSFPPGTQPCHKIIRDASNAYIAVTIISQDFQLVDINGDCNQEAIEFLKISYIDGYGEEVALFYCGKDQEINVTIEAYRVELEFRRESGQSNDGFLLWFEVANATYQTVEPITKISSTAVEIITTTVTEMATTTPLEAKIPELALKVTLLAIVITILVFLIAIGILCFKSRKKDNNPITRNSSIEVRAEQYTVGGKYSTDGDSVKSFVTMYEGKA